MGLIFSDFENYLISAWGMILFLLVINYCTLILHKSGKNSELYDFSPRIVLEAEFLTNMLVSPLNFQKYRGMISIEKGDQELFVDILWTIFVKPCRRLHNSELP